MVQDLLVVGRRPTHPGEILREEFLPDYGLSVAQFAERLGVSRQSANELVHERRSVSASMALRLGRLFGTTAQYWLSMQRNVDLWDSLDEPMCAQLESIEPLAELA
jgi:addiction module HigA family antidote